MIPTTASRSKILKLLRQTSVKGEPLPDVVNGPWIQYPDLVAQITNVIAFVGGVCKVVRNEANVAAELEQYEEYHAASTIWSNVPDIPGNVDLEKIERPHALETVDFTIYRTNLAVAENGAAWISDEYVKHRVVFFIAQHLIIVVNRSRLVHNLHEAYAKVSVRKPGFNCWISGPSKTADIEQSLVIGAHGCRSMQMYIIDDM